MRRTVLATAALAATIGAAAATAQAPDFSGTWKLNRSASQISAGVGLAGLGAGGAPNSLYITHAANGTVTIGSDHNQGMARAYKIGGENAIPAAPNGTVVVKSRWDNRTLVVESTTPQASGDALKETFAMSADGETLTVAVTLSSAAGPRTTTLIYTKTLTESPCKSWPTPCRQ